MAASDNLSPKQFNRPLVRPAEMADPDMRPGAKNYPRKKFNVHAEMGKSWKAVTPPNSFDMKTGAPLPVQPGAISIVTPENGDAWTNWPEHTDPDKIRMAKKLVKNNLTREAQKSRDPKVRMQSRQASYKANQIQSAIQNRTNK
jgi:hypothetical protein